MFSEDYILRMINQVIAALYALVGLKKAGKYQEAAELIDQNLEILVGLKANLIRYMSEENVLKALTQQEELDIERLALVAKLMKEEGEILSVQKREVESQDSYSRALGFYLEVMFRGGSGGQEEIGKEVEEILNRVGKERLNEDRLWGLSGYYEQMGKYREGEEMLLEIYRRPEWSDEIQPELKGYYERMLEKTDEELQEGKLSREELQARLGKIG